MLNHTIHRAWLVMGVTLLALVAAAAFRSTTGALLMPFETEYGWSRTETSGAVTLNLVIYGLTAPFAAALMQKFNLRTVIIGALLTVALGSGLTVLMTDLWQLYVLWGGLVGVGTGAMALVFGSIVANRWFVKHRGLVMGCFSAANACGQLAFLPVVVHLAEHQGWRYAVLLVTGFSLLIVPLLLWPFAPSPERVGLRPFGAALDYQPPAPPTGSAAGFALRVLREGARTRPFWILVASFWVCGWSTNGLIQTHFIPAAHDHGMPADTAASLLALIGIFDVVGTVLSGWLTDKMQPWILLVFYYGLRGGSLFLINSMLGPTVEPHLWVFIVFYGLDWVATVPPTVALCRQYFGAERAGVVFGWVFASHMVGAGVGASFAGLTRELTGSYLWAWLSAAVLCLVAAALFFWLPKKALVAV